MNLSNNLLELKNKTGNALSYGVTGIHSKERNPKLHKQKSIFCYYIKEKMKIII